MLDPLVVQACSLEPFRKHRLALVARVEFHHQVRVHLIGSTKHDVVDLSLQNTKLPSTKKRAEDYVTVIVKRSPLFWCESRHNHNPRSETAFVVTAANDNLPDPARAKRRSAGRTVASSMPT